MKKYSNLGIFNSKGRLFYEAKNKFRSAFQRDRDRIVHSASFRRLKHKTQVFVNTDGDHYRTRITHSIEVSQIARTIAKYLGLNDDLAETLSLSHDLGHTPFGHAGERALHECMINYGGFDHNLQTLRIVMFLEHKYINFKGLNLSLETLDGLLKHNGPYNEIDKINKILGLKSFKDKINFKNNTYLEAQIASVSDDVAYNNHDIQDGLNAKLFKLEELIEIDFFNKIYKKFKKKINKNNKNIIIYQIIRDSINLMVKDIIDNTIKNLKNNNIKNLNDVIKTKKNLVCFSDKFKKIENETKNFLRNKMYNNKEVLKKNNKGQKIIIKLFEEISKKPKKYLIIDKNFNKFRNISDYISGMTDRFAINIYNSIK